MAEGYMMLTYETNSNEFITFGYNKINRIRQGRKFDLVWNGDHTIESLSGIRNQKYIRTTYSSKFKNLINLINEFGIPYYKSGFQFWGIGRVLWSTHVMLRYYPLNLILHHKP